MTDPAGDSDFRFSTCTYLLGSFVVEKSDPRKAQDGRCREWEERRARCDDGRQGVGSPADKYLYVQ